MDSVPQLSQCFFQLFVDGKAPPHYQPILQILETREMQGQNQGRARLSDSIFSYAGCVIVHSIYRQFESDQLTKSNGVIQITDWTRSIIAGKVTFNVVDYKVISIDFPVIGNPQSHSGNPEEYRNQMLAFPQQIQQIQNPQVQATNNSSQSQWRTPTKNEPENVLGSSTKRGRGSSPNDLRQPVSKRQPTNPMSNIVPINFITPYCNKWRICGIVSGKDPQIKEITNARGNFKVFGFIITDKAGSSIRASVFGETAERIFPLVENGGVYYISGGARSGSVKSANKQYNNTGHDYELVLDRDTEVMYSQEQFDAPKMRLKPVFLANIPQRVNECIDVQAVIDRVGEVSQVISRKDQKELNKRDLFMVDKTNTEVRFTLWGDEAVNFSIQPGIVVGVKGALVREFNGGFSLGSGLSSQLIENPDSEYTQELYTWYQNRNPNQEIKTLSGTDASGIFERDFRFVGQIIQQQSNNQENEKGQYFYVKAVVSAVKSEQATYQACPKQGCKKKVISDGNKYRCEKCNEEFDTYSNLIMLQIEIADFTGTAWVTLFDEVASNLLGVKADQLAELQREDHVQFDAIFNKIRFHEFLFRARVRFENYNDQQQIRWSVFDVKSVPYEKCKPLYQNALQQLGSLGLHQQTGNPNSSFY